MKLKTEFTFDAAHKLEGYVGKCSNMHGHMWRVVLWIEGGVDKLDDVGILWDFSNSKLLEKELDHKCLNDIVPFNSTAEHIALYILGKLKEDREDLKFTVRVYESPKSYAEAESE